MEPLVLSDKSKTPTDELIFSIIGKNSEYWENLMIKVKEKFPASTGVWNYYNDGKNWLFKMTNKKKTLFWIGIHSDTFRVSFYFGDKAEQLISHTELPDPVKEQYFTGQRFGKIRAISFKVNEPSYIDYIITLSEIKSKL